MRKYGPFVLGMITMALLVSVVQSAAATSEQVRFNTAGIALFGEEKVAAGETYTAPNGQKVPSVITYIDETGGTTNYLSVRQISELFDAKISWNAQEKRVTPPRVCSIQPTETTFSLRLQTMVQKRRLFSLVGLTRLVGDSINSQP